MQAVVLDENDIRGTPKPFVEPIDIPLIDVDQVEPVR
jgi:hypothetical protein